MAAAVNAAEHSAFRLMADEFGGLEMTMRSLLLAITLLMATPVMAEDNEAGVPLSPKEAAGAWVLESQGHSLCRLTLGTAKIGGDAYSVKRAADCAGELPGQPIGWKATADGMALVGADGGTILSFNRWSNSLFVSHRSSGIDVQLRRAG